MRVPSFDREIGLRNTVVRAGGKVFAVYHHHDARCPVFQRGPCRCDSVVELTCRTRDGSPIHVLAYADGEVEEA